MTSRNLNIRWQFCGFIWHLKTGVIKSTSKIYMYIYICLWCHTVTYSILFHFPSPTRLFFHQWLLTLTVGSLQASLVFTFISHPDSHISPNEWILLLLIFWSNILHLWNIGLYNSNNAGDKSGVGWSNNAE